LYFSANLVLSQAFVVACALLYQFYYEEGSAEAQPHLISPSNATLTNSTGTGKKLTEEQLRVSVGGLLATFLFSFTLFMVKIDRKYVKTLFSTETGHGKAKRLFLTEKTDFEKAQIFTCQKRQWTSIRGEVAEWLDANWDRWERDKPDWFNSVFIASVDDDIMPKRALAAENQKAGVGSRRRSSLLDHISVRAYNSEGDNN
jgi:hypothetical protein